MPPCGTIGVRVSLASFRIAETSATVPGRSTSGVRAVELVARLGQIGRDRLGVAERVAAPTIAGEPVEQRRVGGIHGAGY